jgi:ribosomal protein S18 acetylase RimI-like enzyme
MIELIKITELQKALDLFEDVTNNMISNGINQWDSIYPNPATITTDIVSNHAHGYYLNNELVGYISINIHYDKEYESVTWEYPDVKPFIIHRLAIKSGFQGMGIAKKLMSFAENTAKSKEHHTIRLDAFSQNPTALSLYQRLGYRLAGKVTFRKGIFYCFEKSLK